MIAGATTKHGGGLTMKEFLKVMKVLSEPSRVNILKLLQSETLCVGELTDSLRLAQPTISKHLPAWSLPFKLRREEGGRKIVRLSGKRIGVSSRDI
jgi:DNA-binding transcriptional ArsR family regulator